MNFPEIVSEVWSLDAAILVVVDLVVCIIQLFFMVALSDVLSLALQPPAKLLLIQPVPRYVVSGEDLIDLGVYLGFSPLLVAFESA